MVAKPDTSKFVTVGRAKFYFDEIIDVGTAKDMIDIYETRVRQLVKKTYGFNDSKAITFDLDKMQHFIDEVKSAGGKQARLYFGIYPADGKYPRQTTIIAMGVKPDGTDVIMDKGSLTKADGLDPYNHGNLCPPGHDCKIDD